MLTSPYLWALLVLTVSLPVAFLIGVRYLAVRVGGRPTAGQLPLTAAELPSLSSFINLRSLRTLLLLAVLAGGTAVVLVRFVFGLGSVTNLNDQFTWGIWIGFDMMGGVALAAGAFVIGAVAHIFGRHRWEPLVRPAILTGFLGYLLAVCGLIFDLGRPWNIWRPLVHWQHNSVMWEVGMCVATYTTVLLIEFLPVALERINKFEAVTKRLPTIPIYRLLSRSLIVFVILGVILSTLHQSSLGSLWVLVPEKLHPLWYSIFLPVFFWLSAVMAGLTMTIVESTLSAKAFRRGLELDLLADLGKWAARVLFIYLLVRTADLVARDAWTYLFQPTIQAAAYWVEIGLGILLPMILLAIRPLRYRPRVLFTSAFMVVVFGIIVNRLNISVLGMWDYTGYPYLPTWMEVVVSISLVTLGVLAFGLAAKYLPVFPEEGSEH